MSKINKIKVSGTSYDLEDRNAAKSVTLTQAEYDALVTAGTVDSNTFYVISDSEFSMDDYWTSAETQSAITQATSGLQETLSAGTGIDITDNVISATGGGGGGKAIEAGRGISVTTGATADTVSFNLPISAGTANNSLIFGTTNNTATTTRACAFGSNTKAKGENAFTIGYNTETKEDNAFAAGQYAVANGFVSMSLGRETITNNMSEFACGQDNVSNKASNTYGDSGNTLFSVGNGTYGGTRHNAFEIRQNGDIYITSGGTDIKLQDNLGGGGGGASYSAGTGIDITNDVISVTGMVATSAVTSAVTSGSTDVLTSGGAYSQLGGLKLVKLTQSEYNALSPNYDSNTLYVIVN